MFREKGKMPLEVYNMPFGEKLVTRRFLEYELKERLDKEEEVAKLLKKGGK